MSKRTLDNWLLKSKKHNVDESIHPSSVNVKQTAAVSEVELTLSGLETSSNSQDWSSPIYQKLAKKEDSMQPEKKPYQPKFIPPQTTANRSFYFQLSWYKQYPWLHYDTTERKMFCFSCTEAIKKDLFTHGHKVEEAFVNTGFSNWQHGSDRLKKHELSKQHRDAVTKLVTHMEAPIVKKICSATIKKQEQALKSLKIIFTSLMYLAKQGLAIRGSENDNGNFLTLLKLRSNDIPDLRGWLSRPKSYTSPEIQNEILQIMSHSVLRNIISTIQNSTFYSVIVDETTDVSVHEQVSISIRIANTDYEAEEYFLGLYETSMTTGDTLSKVILDVLQRFDIPIERMRGQCYDGASNMAGHFKGVQSRIAQLEPRAVYVHCFNHCLNLAVQDCVSENSFFRDHLSCVNDIGTILSTSPKRIRQFEEILRANNQNIIKLKPLCPTRWTVRVRAIESVLSGYDALLTFLEELGNANENISPKAKGLCKKMENGEFYLGLQMGKNIFSIAEDLSKILQSPESTINGSVEAAAFTVHLLMQLKSEEKFEHMWKNMLERCELLDLEEPVLPRVRRKPTRYDDGTVKNLFTSAKDRLQSIYFDAIDSACREIKHRFDQPGIKLLGKVESIVLSKSSTISMDTLNDICSFYGWDEQKLLAELGVLNNTKASSWTSIKDAITEFKKLATETRKLFPVFEEVLKTLVVVPCSSAGAERSFSRLRRIKSYLRSTMLQTRLNHCCILNCYSDTIDQLDIDKMLHEFIGNRNRTSTFGNL